MQYDIIIRRKNIKRLNMRIRDGIVYVSAPFFTSDSLINNFINKNKEWIEKNIQKMSNETNFRDYSVKNNSPIYILGYKYEIEINNAKEDKVYIGYDKLYINTTNNNDIYNGKLVVKYLYSLAEDIFKESIDKYLKITGKSLNSLKIKQVESYNGKCFTKRKEIVLNLNIIHEDISYIEAISMHEIAHLEYPNHQKEFYDYIEKYMPDYNDRMKRKR